MRLKNWRGHLPQTGDQCQVKVEYVLKPLHGSRGLVGQDLDQVGTRLISCGLECILVKLFDTVLDPQVYLGPCEGTVDPRSGLGGVATKEAYQTRSQQTCRGGQCDTCLEGRELTLLIQDQHISTVQVDGVGGAEARHCNALVSMVQGVCGEKLGSAYIHHQRR